MCAVSAFIKPPGGELPALKIIRGYRNVACGVVEQIQNEEIGIDLFRAVVNIAVRHRSEDHDVRVAAGQQELRAAGSV